MNILIIDMCPEKDSLWKGEFVRPIIDIACGNCDCEVYHFTEDFNSDNYDKIILSGSPLGDFEYLKYIDKFEWLKTIEKPVLGICAGMQVISKVFGCDLIDCQEIGMTKIKTIKENKLFCGEFEAYSLHNSAVKINENFEILAESDKCAQAIKHNETDISGVLFHPEARNKLIISRFINN